MKVVKLSLQGRIELKRGGGVRKEGLAKNADAESKFTKGQGKKNPIW